MPQLSLIVPVYNVEAYVRECLESILDQDVQDMEVLVVDDASTDNSALVVEDVARHDDRVRFIRLDVNGGLGNARNEGLKVATGDYVLFVDSDDWLERGSLPLISSRLTDTDPDVLIFDYARSNWLGKSRRNAKADVLRRATPDAFTLHDHPDLLNLLMVVWNKAYRRSFIEDLKLTFPEGYYEDLPWTYPVLVAAQRISVLDEVCYYYRQRRHGNILGTSSRKHFEVFAQYDRVFAFLDAHPELEEWRPLLVHRMAEHVLTILDKGEQRVPGKLRREFFTTGTAMVRKHGAGVPSVREERIEEKLLRRGSYPLFQAFGLARRVRGVLRAPSSERQLPLRRTLWRYRDRLYRLLYALFRLLPLDPKLAVFSAYWNRGYSCNPGAISDRARELAPDVRRVWIVNQPDVVALPDGVDHVQPKTLRYYWVMARAKFFVNNVNFGDEWVKRKGSVQVQTHHGTPLKKMGVDLKKFPVAARQLNFNKLLARTDKWDYSLSSNHFSTEMWGRSNPANYEHLEYGYPRNDIFYTADPEVGEEVRRELGIGPDKIAILYAPTFRDWEDEFTIPLDLPRFCDALGEDYVLMVRGHYFHLDVAALSRLEASGALIDVTSYPDTQRLCLASDMLLTDYSSIQFDYANLARPIVVYAPDWELYYKLRGVNFDFLREPPGAVATTEDELLEIFTTRAYEAPPAREHLLQFRNRYCEFDDGRAAERVVRHVLLGQDVSGLLPASERPAPVAAPSPLGTVSRGRTAMADQAAEMA